MVFLTTEMLLALKKISVYGAYETKIYPSVCFTVSEEIEMSFEIPILVSFALAVAHAVIFAHRYI